MTAVAKRDTAIDIFRAVTMLLMVFVNDFWTVGDIPHCFEHGGTSENFLGLADFVFPAFLFVMGLSIPYAIESRYEKGLSESSTVFHILGRTFALLVMGVFFVNTEVEMSRDMIVGKSLYRVLMITGFLLVWNVRPKNPGKTGCRVTAVCRILGVALLAFLAVIYRDSSGGVLQARWWGILGQIGWAYLLCAFLYLAWRRKIGGYIAVWALLLVLCVLCAEKLLPRESAVYAFLRILNIPPGAKAGYCLAGVITTLTALRIAGWSRSKQMLSGLSVAAVLLAAGFLARHIWIFSKNMQTPSTMLVCTAVSLLCYILIKMIVSKGWDRGFGIIRSAGTACLTCYMMPIFLYSAARLAGIDPQTSLHGFLGVAKCLLFAFVCVWLTALLEKINIKLKI